MDSEIAQQGGLFLEWNQLECLWYPFHPHLHIQQGEPRRVTSPLLHHTASWLASNACPWGLSFERCDVYAHCKWLSLQQVLYRKLWQSGSNKEQYSLNNVAFFFCASCSSSEILHKTRNYTNYKVFNIWKGKKCKKWCEVSQHFVFRKGKHGG